MRKIILSCSFIFSSLMMVLAFVTATTYLHLAAAITIYIAFMYAAYITLPQKTGKVSVKKPATAVQPSTVVDERKSQASITDIDKREFLKMIGAAGLSLFLYSIFIKKGETPFFRSVSGQSVVSLDNWCNQR